ncbi:TOG array regulator of axonemal microtubules protein 2-like [Aethina tumida]|uniref:TOG array regulator of axonemal microtubules protein 2-like n=1 Tax=Aethina tumida TaxID=116153 RepID=UPI002147CD17|nr:TOG array regulator of axonemal microtubules protein 2-like [Aethina tumida]XP_049820724.1 TOG array regulator of axonemal microtubules protein 2-like [Aethina tumida]
MTSVNQKLIVLLKSSRSQVCLSACQTAGHLFEHVADTGRPEFDDIVDILLCKTADSNKSIRIEANAALDCMVTHIAPTHSVRALCMRGPSHKNPLVRIAVARLLLSVVELIGVDKIMSEKMLDGTRKRIINTMAMVILDNNMILRKMGHQLYSQLSKDQNYKRYSNKYLDKETRISITSIIKKL